MSIYEIIGIFFTIYLTASGIAAHLWVMYHGQDRVKRRNTTGRLHEYEAEKTMMEIRHAGR